jgi:hypothetical protein
VTVLLGAFKLAMTFVAVSFVDTAGRRPLLLAGVSTMVAALVALGALSAATAAAGGGAGAVAPALAWGSVAALLLYVGAYQVTVPAFAICPLAWLGSALSAAVAAGFWFLVYALLSRSLMSGFLVTDACSDRRRGWEEEAVVQCELFSDRNESVCCAGVLRPRRVADCG